MDVGEVFGVWVIEGPAGLEDKLPFKKAGVNVMVVPDESALSAKASTLRSYMLDHNQNCIFIHSSRTDSVLCSLVAGISWFFLVCFYWIINFT